MDANETAFQQRRISFIRENVVSACERAIGTMESFLADARRELERTRLPDADPLDAASAMRLVNEIMAKAAWAAANVQTKLSHANGEVVSLAKAEASLGGK